jgi:putative restriction endonuclease
LRHLLRCNSAEVKYLAAYGLSVLAFDAGLITISLDYTILISNVIKKSAKFDSTWFLPFEGKKIILPQRFLPSNEFLKYHNEHIFVG